MSNFIQVTPFMHVEDIERALAFFTGILAGCGKRDVAT